MSTSRGLAAQPHRGERIDVVRRPLDTGQKEGTAISHYRVLRALGRGGMGVVHLAEDVRLRRLVALKFLSDEIAGDPEWVARFEREAQAASALNHPGICTVYEIGDEGGRPFIAMEYLEGGTLREHLAGGALPLPRVLDIGRQLASALEAAHTRGITHRDIKPENVFLTGDGAVKLLDFGLAKRDVADAAAGPDAKTTAQLTRDGTVFGTAGYMSPEQIRGRPVDARSDIFSLGVTLYEAAAGAHPFAGETPAVTLSNILEKPPRPLSDFTTSAAPELEGVFDRALEKDPSRRYQSAADLGDDLQRARDGAGEPRSRPWRRLGWFKPGHRRVLTVAALTVALAALALAAVMGTALLRRESAASADVTSLAVLPFVNESGDPKQEYFSDGLSEELLNRLARLPGLKVAGRTSSFRFKRSGADVRSIGATLNVGAVLEGTVRKDGNRLRVETQLVKTRDGFQLWSESYDRETGDVFAIQDGIARAVSSALQLRLLGGNRTGSSGTTNPDAYNAYLEGKFLLARRNRDEFARAQESFETAVRLDPNFARGFVGLGNAYRDQASWAFIPMAAGLDKARGAVLRALQLDPDLAEAHTALAALQLNQDFDVAAAEKSYERARQLNHNSTDALLGAAVVLRLRGRFDEALELARRAAETDPLNRSALTKFGDMAARAGRLEDAAAAYRKVIELDPDFGFGHTNLAVVYLLQGRPDAAQGEMEKEKMEGARIFGTSLVQHALGNEAGSLAALNECVARFGDDAAYQIAQLHAFRGERAKALEWLQRAYAHRDGGILGMLGDPLLESVQTEPAFLEIAARLR